MCELLPSSMKHEKLDKAYSLQYDFLTEIHETFEHVYLLLNCDENSVNHLLKPDKAKTAEQIEIFTNTVNDFLKTSADEKSIHVDYCGNIYFTTQYSHEHISIDNLSSGEKRIVTFFAYLVFALKQDNSGIFIVDEPELSLHLLWQKIFVQKILSVNANIQLIFATHSPEFVSYCRDKMVKLEKTVI